LVNKRHPELHRRGIGHLHGAWLVIVDLHVCQLRQYPFKCLPVIL
jgi:hypothetical protein